jgi:GT2 family glycosyltransferase
VDLPAPPESPVTVVIPVWGRYADTWLDDAIASIREQPLSAEIILVDNANEPPLRRDGVTVVRSDRRLSIGGARNLGLESVRTPYLVFWDADDLMIPDTLNRLVGCLEDDPGLVASGASMLEHPMGNPHHWPRRRPLALARLPRLFAAINAVTSLFPVVGSALRTEQAQQARFPDADVGDDWAFGASLALRGRVVVDSRPGRQYRLHPDSVSAAWTRGDVLGAAALVRRQLARDPALPAFARRLVPLLAGPQHAILRVLRPLRRAAASTAGARPVAPDLAEASAGVRAAGDRHANESPREAPEFDHRHQRPIASPRDADPAAGRDHPHPAQAARREDPHPA